MLRMLLILGLALLIAPGTWLRSAPPVDDFSQAMTVAEIAVPDADFGEVSIEIAWHLESPNSYFGSYSALLALPDNMFLAASDTGKSLRFSMPGFGGSVEIDRFAGRTALQKKLIDIESLARDPATGRIWAGYEGTNTIERLESDLSGAVSFRSAAMAPWSSNSGPESMVRLDNGHFIVISEGREQLLTARHPALLFEGDPVEKPGVRKFTFEAPEGYRPVDMAQLPDGRVLILVRELVFGVPPAFNVKLVVADPSEIEANAVWRGREIAVIADPSLRDNYEGLAITPRDDDRVDLWLISDDNGTMFQRTLLLKLNWDPAESAPETEKAREKPARPANSSS